MKKTYVHFTDAKLSVFIHKKMSDINMYFLNALWGFTG